ncbi:bifunctional enoyl-CoA hydratase/phosphate acetyltransferase [bacterium]|nr:bifunctional enoyl-CoA hydratase/phosphate acetyltransferase [bacterium]
MPELSATITSFNQIFDSIHRCSTRRLAIAGAGNSEIITAINESVNKKIVYPILVGDRNKIQPLIEKVGLQGDYKIIHITGDEEIAQKTAELAKSGEAELLMKGKVPTGTFLKAVLDRKNELRSGELLSHTAVVEVEKYPKLMLFTDGGINVAPNLEQKVAILKNSLRVAGALGISQPKVAVLSAVEVVNPKIPDTLDAQQLVEMAGRGEFGDIDIAGPIAMDLAISDYAAQLKGYHSKVAGEADVFLVPDISTGNITVKALIYLAQAKVGGIIMGASIPIILLSRSDTAEIKLCSIALGCMVVEDKD